MAVVEFALVSVLFLLPMVMAVCEYSWMIKNNLQISNAARNACRRGAVGASTSDIRAEVQREAVVNPSVQNTEVVMEKSTDSGSTWTTLGDTSTTCSSGTTVNVNGAVEGNLVRVTVNHPYKSLTKFFPWLNSGRKVQAIAVFRRETNDSC